MGFCGRYDKNILVCIFPVHSVFLFYSFYNQVTTCTLVDSTENIEAHMCTLYNRMKHIPQSLSQWSLHSHIKQTTCFFCSPSRHHIPHCAVCTETAVWLHDKETDHSDVLSHVHTTSQCRFKFFINAPILISTAIKRSSNTCKC